MHTRKILFKTLGALMAVAMLLAFLPAGDVAAQAATWTVSCDTGCDQTHIQNAIDGAAAGDTIEVSGGPYIFTGGVNVDKAVILKGVDNPRMQVSGTGYRFSMIAAGASLEGFVIQKTDTTAQNIIFIGANGVSIKDNTISGLYSVSSDPTTRAMEIAGSLSELVISGNEIFGLRQPAYINPNTVALIENNNVYGTRGWVVDGANVTFIGNSWGTGEYPNAVDIAILVGTDPTLYTDLITLSLANNGANIEDQRTSPSTLTVVYVDASAPAGGNGNADKPLQTIQAGIDRVTAGGTVHVSPGEYTEFIELRTPNITVKSTNGAEQTFITTPVGTNTIGVKALANMGNLTFDGFTVQAFNMAGIIQPMSQHENTAFHVLNNRVIPAPEYLRNGIQVSGDNSTVINNYILGYRMNEDWSSTAIMVVNASDVLVKDNEVEGGDLGVSLGINVQNYSGVVNNIIIENNLVNNADYGVRVEGNYWAQAPNRTVTNVTVQNNNFVNNKYGVGALWVNLDTINILGNTIENSVIGVRFPTSLTNYGEETQVVNATIESNVMNFNGWQVDSRGSADLNLQGVIENNSLDRAVLIENQRIIYSSIQEAIDAASSGDTIKVGPGTYAEKLELRTPNITVKSTDGAATTIIDVPLGSLTTGVKVLANMGTVTFDGFTVKNFTEGGIIQGMSAGEGTTFHVLNNVVLPYDYYLRNGIQVSGDGSTVKGNYVEGAYLTPDWGSTGILVANASNVIVQNNEVSGELIGLDMGLGVLNWNKPTMSNIQFMSNTVYGADYAVVIHANSGTISDVELDKNKITDYLYPLYAYASGPGISVTDIDASPNWWGSKVGPLNTVYGDVDYTPWCGDAECSFLVGGGVIEKTILLDESGKLLLLDGTEIHGDGACFDVQADSVEIYTESPGGAICYPGSPGIVVADGTTDFRVTGLIIDGSTSTEGGHGVEFLGAVTDVIVNDILFRNLTGDAIHFTEAPGDYVEIKGNLFLQDGLAVNVDGLDVEFNSWGSMDGPAAGDLPEGYTVDDWTHVDIYIEYVGATRYADEVALGEVPAEEITYNVYANLENAFGAQFTLTFDSAYLELVGTDTTGTVFPWPFDDTGYEGTVLTQGVTVDGNKVTFNGASITPVSGTAQFLFSVTFKGLAPTALDNPLFFDVEDVDLFGMNPGYAGSLSASLNIYAYELVGVEDVNVYELPELDADPLEDYVVGNPKEFTLTVTNPATGRAYTDLNVDLVVPTGAVLEYWDGSAWVAYVDGVDIGALAVDATADVLFRITFATASAEEPVTASLYDGEIFLVTETFLFNVTPSFTVTGSIQMQGRTVRSGVEIRLISTRFGYEYVVTSLDMITGNFTIENVPEGDVTMLVTQDRYLDIVSTGTGYPTVKGFTVTGDVTLARLELRGGDLNNDELVGILDASILGTYYGQTGDTPGDANFDGKVNIQDLAMIGGNFDLTSTAAYATWVP